MSRAGHVAELASDLHNTTSIKMKKPKAHKSEDVSLAQTSSVPEENDQQEAEEHEQVHKKMKSKKKKTGKKHKKKHHVAEEAEPQ